LVVLEMPKAISCLKYFDLTKLEYNKPSLPLYVELLYAA